MRKRKKRPSAVNRHVRIHEWELSTPAYRTLSTCARALLIEFRSLYCGRENRIHMSVREAMRRLNVGQKAAEKAVAELIDRGWIRVIEKGTFHRKVKHATVYALENEPLEENEALPPKSYMQWKKPP